MATTITSATLTVKVVEDLILDNTQLGRTTTKSIAGITKWAKRVVTVSSSNSVTLFGLGTPAAQGVYEASEVKFIRFTNKDDANFVELQVKDSTGAFNGATFKLQPGASFLLFSEDADIAASSPSLPVTFSDIAEFDAIADTADVDLEYALALAG